MDLRECLEREYAISVDASFRTGGTRAETLLVRTQHGDRFVRFYDDEHLAHRRAVDDVFDERDVAFAVPRPICSRMGSRFTAFGDRWIAVYERMPGSRRERSVQDSHALGEALARFHGSLEGVSIPSAWRDAFSPIGVERYDELFDDLRERYATTIAGLPRGVIHADFIFENVLFEDGSVCSVLDLDTMRPDALVRDLAVTLAIEGFTDTKPNACYDLIIAGYDSVRSLSELERSVLPAFIVDAAFDSVLWARKTESEEVAQRYERVGFAALSMLG